MPLPGAVVRGFKLKAPKHPVRKPILSKLNKALMSWKADARTIAHSREYGAAKSAYSHRRESHCALVGAGAGRVTGRPDGLSAQKKLTENTDSGDDA